MYQTPSQINPLTCHHALEWNPSVHKHYNTFFKSELGSPVHCGCMEPTRSVKDKVISNAKCTNQEHRAGLSIDSRRQNKTSLLHVRLWIGRDRSTIAAWVTYMQLGKSTNAHCYAILFTLLLLIANSSHLNICTQPLSSSCWAIKTSKYLGHPCHISFWTLTWFTHAATCSHLAGVKKRGHSRYRFSQPCCWLQVDVVDTCSSMCRHGHLAVVKKRGRSCDPLSHPCCWLQVDCIDTCSQIS